MKKIVIFFCMILITVTGCSFKQSNLSNKKENLEGTLSEIMEQLYKTSTIKEEIYTSFIESEVTEDNLSYHLGVDKLDYKEALVSEPMISSDAYSVVLVRMNEGADIEKAKKEIKEKVDPRKWVCTGVEDSNVIVDSYGDIIILIMSDDYAKDLEKSFKKLGGNL